MEGKKKNSNLQLEINNLIDNAVNNAVARRNPVEDLEDALQLKWQHRLLVKQS
ncbi:hypothetical protein LC653_21190 [Nostoc sp. CHAB 5784]|uniref:hypothetical protein n=1 Tax=Nostoc mirabile TaxID=2907820 RepID=UPI001E43EEB4|nr:hypothetical protein [Nostoc mirabile]MCC5666363.1 hypothetical protein [Nostoc mirabile CHAB5784]